MTSDVEPGGSSEPPPEASRDVALFVDWENIRFSLSPRGYTPSVAAILDACGRFGRVVLSRAYADWQSPTLAHDPAALYVGGIEPIYVPVRRYREESGGDTVKNSVDVRIAVDAIELVHTHPQIEVFVLASGDQDFLHVVNRLRANGKRVVGLSISWTASPRLVERVDHMIFYDRELGLGIEPEERPVAAGPPSTTPLEDTAEAIAEAEQLEREAARRVVNAVRYTLTEYRSNKREITLAGLGAELQQHLGDHLFRMAVRGRLQRISRVMERHGELKIVSRGVDDWLYLPDEEAEPLTEPAVAAPPAPRTSAAPRGQSTEWALLPPDLKLRAIQVVADLAKDPKLDYITFNRIRDALNDSDLGVDHDGHRLANTMVAAAVLIQDQERQWYDVFTGRTGTFWSMSLNRENEEVRRALPDDSGHGAN
ncbi:MAG: NYN domain-containing protein [Dehalococcoidia bacterium]|nr:NYN domain-containing protein [Dehalococcoidia bacterium]